MRERIFPCMLSKCCDIFSFKDSSFGVNKQKEGTARVVMWKELNIINSYTLEASFCGADYGKYAEYHFNTEMLEDVGEKFCSTLFEMCDSDQCKVKQALEELEILYPRKNEDSEINYDSGNDSDGSNDDKKNKGKRKAKKKTKKDDTKEAKEPPKLELIKKISLKKQYSYIYYGHTHSRKENYQNSH
jgi:hypothetical protein